MYMEDINTADRLKRLQERIDYHFKNEKFLTEALTHPSFAYESRNKETSDNSRMEFLGDSILGMVVAERLYRENPTLFEGELTRLRSLLVNRDHLAGKAKELGIGECLRVGKGEEKTGGRRNPANLAGALEALIASIYLDSSIEEAKSFILRVIS
ncbi:MAG: hypothetical protein A2987_00915 [Omnitrophica bacterium RIFCSPLOWO2_01_FULL_45_10]|nr:MAG: hypothetical protein A2987_00915 [Omnitrophica bacterium RIFCSPLOWO2_01_FULL_45_10]